MTVLTLPQFHAVETGFASIPPDFGAVGTGFALIFPATFDFLPEDCQPLPNLEMPKFCREKTSVVLARKYRVCLLVAKLALLVLDKERSPPGNNG